MTRAEAQQNLRTGALGVAGVPRSLPAVRALAREWRRLGSEAGIAPVKNGDLRRRTLIACSAGPDSSALAIALAAAVSRPERIFVLAHVVHDLRPAEEALADRDAARELAARLGLPFAEAAVRARSVKGNLEAAARSARYRALARLASEHDCRLVVTAHHAGDQVEGVLMALLRGSGPLGLAGVRERRSIGRGIELIRPCLSVERESLLDLCSKAGWTPRQDATNTDVSRLRALLRNTILPELEVVRPGVRRSIAQAARVQGRVAEMLSDAAAQFLEAHTLVRDGGWSLPRRELASLPRIVQGEVVRHLLKSRRSGGHDRIGAGLGPLLRAVNDASMDPRRFRIGPHSLTLTAYELRTENP